MPLLRITDLEKTYRSPDGTQHTVLDVPSLTMEPGEQVALAGGSGSGKTTLLNVIAGILRPDSGSVVIGDVDLTALPESGRDAFRAAHLGYVFQTFNLLQGYSALENVLLGMMFGPGPDEEYARLLLDELGMSDRLHHRPRQLSIGQQQRVAVARALANHPALVLADEPTGNLDQHNATEALRMLRDVCERHVAALLLVSHDAGVLGQFDRVVRLDEINRAAAGVDGGDA